MLSDPPYLLGNQPKHGLYGRVWSTPVATTVATTHKIITGVHPAAPDPARSTGAAANDGDDPIRPIDLGARGSAVSSTLPSVGLGCQDRLILDPRRVGGFHWPVPADGAARSGSDGCCGPRLRAVRQR
jgi:hypothetical protein